MDFFTLLIGISSIALSVMVIVVMFILRKNVVDILNKDAIIFSKNFEIKKSAFDKAMYIIDEIGAGAPRSKTIEYSRKMNQLYNDLMFVASDVRIADTFISMATDLTKVVTPNDVANFKLMCRKDLGLNIKNSALSNQIKANKK